MVSINKSVLITGASSGIGKACALYLDKMGFLVYGGVRTERDAKTLKAESSDMLEPIFLDVTKKETISDAVRAISCKSEYPFFGLVNNAGLGLRGVLEATPEEELRRVLEVNVIGLHAVTRALLPLLRRNKGRIVNMGSENSFTAGPNGSSYAASKFAVRAISDSLRLEMVPFGVTVSLIAPTSTESKTWDKLIAYRKQLRASVSDELFKDYSFFFDSEENVLVSIVKPIPANEVAMAVAHALTAKNPHFEYSVGKDSEKAYRTSLRSKSNYTREKIIELENSIEEWKKRKGVNNTE